MQDRLEINKRSINQFQNVLTRMGRLRLKQGQRKNISETKKVQKILKHIFKNKIKNIEKKNDLLKNSNSENEFNQIAVMRGLSRDQLEQVAKIRRIKNYENMKKEDLIISLLKSKENIAELFNK